MIDGKTLALKADAIERSGVAGAKSLARHLRRWARIAGFPAAPMAVELPALPGLTVEDLEGLGIHCRRTSDGLVIIRPAGRA